MILPSPFERATVRQHPESIYIKELQAPGGGRMVVAILYGDGICSDARRATMSLPRMLKANIDAAASEAHGKISKQVVHLDEVTAIKVTFSPGAKWSADLKDYAGTNPVFCRM
jgi:hypothetical protein